MIYLGVVGACWRQGYMQAQFYYTEVLLYFAFEVKHGIPKHREKFGDSKWE